MWRGATALGMVVALVVWLAPPASAAATFSGPTNFAVNGTPASVASGDLNGDGRLDLAVANFFSDSVSVLLNTTPLSNLAVAKSCNPTTMLPGAVVTCTLRVTNAGPSPATSVVVTDALPAGLTVVGTPAGGGFTCATAAASPQVSCTRATLPVGGAAKVITVVARVSDSIGPQTDLTDTATVSSATADPEPANNTASFTVSTPTCTIDLRTASRNPVTINGTPGKDVICGSAFSDIINGKGGADILFGLAGNDIINGGGGNDTLFGGAGDDTLSGQAGTDTATGGANQDICTAEQRTTCED